MLKLYSSVSKMPIFSVNTESKVADFVDFLVDVKQILIKAIFVETKDFFKSEIQIVPMQNVLEWSNAIYVQDPDNIVSLTEIVRFKKMIDDNFSLIGLPVFDSKKNRIGIIEDFLFEPHTGQIVRFYIQEGKYFSNLEYVANINQVKVLKDSGMILKTGYQKEKLKMEEKLVISGKYRII